MCKSCLAGNEHLKNDHWYWKGSPVDLTVCRGYGHLEYRTGIVTQVGKSFINVRTAEGLIKIHKSGMSHGGLCNVEDTYPEWHMYPVGHEITKAMKRRNRKNN